LEVKAVTRELIKTKADAIIVGYFEDSQSPGDIITAIDMALDGNITQLLTRGDIKGKLNEVTVIHSLGKLPAGRIVILGLGKRTELTKDKIRRAVAETARSLRKAGVLDIATMALGMGEAGIGTEDAARCITEGALLGLYSFRKHMTSEPDYKDIKQITIAEPDETLLFDLEEGCRKGKIIAEAAILTRDMVNEPANYMTPTDMADTATELAETYRLRVNIFDKEEMRELGMGALLGVSQGSIQPPKFIVLRYNGNDSTEKIDLALVGKGITFDSGGLSLKTTEGMADMKGDMAGGAVVMAVISAIAQLSLQVNILAAVPTTENMPGGRALKPGDVLTATNGKTIEIINTDAEGRLILADALAYTRTFDPRYIIDVATLTGACHVALGDVCTGVFGNNQRLVDMVIKAGNDAGEMMWQMPMYNEYKEQLKSEVADIKNTGGRGGGAVTAAKFLEAFVGDTPWVHLDIAGTDQSEKEQGYLTKGSTGIPVRTLVNLIMNLKKIIASGGKG
jgi:leucyl aminopeptidase